MPPKRFKRKKYPRAPKAGAPRKQGFLPVAMEAQIRKRKVMRKKEKALQEKEGKALADTYRELAEKYGTMVGRFAALWKKDTELEETYSVLKKKHRALRKQKKTSVVEEKYRALKKRYEASEAKYKVLDKRYESSKGHRRALGLKNTRIANANKRLEKRLEKRDTATGFETRTEKLDTATGFDRRYQKLQAQFANIQSHRAKLIGQNSKLQHTVEKQAVWIDELGLAIAGRPPCAVDTEDTEDPIGEEASCILMSFLENGEVITCPL